MNNFIRKYGFFTAIFSLFCFSAFIQQRYFFNCDVSWLLEASKRLLAGGTYTKDFFENNPPWILYFYLPPVIVSNFFAINIMITIYGYVIIAAILSLLISWHLLKKIIEPNDLWLAKMWLLALTFIFLLLPSYEFGQREHFFIILLVPYLLLISMRLQEKTCDTRLALGIGFLAGSVLLIKPYFLPTLFLVELYYCFIRRKFFAFLRPEIVVFVVMGIGYAAILMTRHQMYLTEVMPIALRWCHIADHLPFAIILTTPLAIYSICALFFGFIASYYRYPYPSLIIVFSIALLGFLFSYLIQHTSALYHLLPAVAAAFLLYLHFFVVNAYKTPSSKLKIMILTLFFLAFLSWYMEYFVFYFLALINFKEVFFLLIFFSFLIFLVMNEKKMTGAQWLKIIIFMMISYIFFNYLIIKIVWDNLKIIIMILSSFIILGCFIPGNIKNKSKGIFYSSMSFMLITPIIFSLLYSYSSNTLIKKQYQPLVHFLNQYAANEKVYFLSTHLHLGYPIITYSKAESASRFPSFWMLAGLVRHSLNDSDPISRQHEIEDKNKIIEMVSEDLKKHKPKYIFIDTSEKKGRFAFFKKEKNEFTLNSIPFEYLPLFLTNKHFSEAWVSYRYFTRIKEPQQESIYQAAFPYQVDVYERI